MYNTSSYDSLDSIRRMGGVVGIYMPDFKLWDPEHWRRYLLAREYLMTAQEVVKALHRQVGS